MSYKQAPEKHRDISALMARLKWKYNHFLESAEE